VLSDPLLIATVLLISAALAASAGLLILQLGLLRVFSQAPQLQPLIADDPSMPFRSTSLTVVIPAFNEADNIGSCLASVLSSDPPCQHWQVVVVDDGSTDTTSEVAVATARACSTTSAEFTLLDAGPRPAGERWVGKNWACTRAMDRVQSEWVLFVDADVCLKPDAIRRALNQAMAEEVDLFSLAPRLVCGCLAEWMVQPIMASLLGLGFPIVAANNPNSTVAFAAGPFMLFRRSAYVAIGGHRELASEVVEDLALARRIKQSGYRLRYLLGLDVVDLRMYKDLASLWEGWTKNWLLGLECDVFKALGASAAVVLMFAAPWILVVSSFVLMVLFPSHLIWWLTLSAFCVVAIGQQLFLRLWQRHRFAVPITNWWLMGAGGLFVGAIGPVSVWRTLTGQGWTWKGRPLA
jgi:cellulose synthase/poly-beta-1,6-N-acetylglucosamine synthase-like glycosyltransferase